MKTQEIKEHLLKQRVETEKRFMKYFSPSSYSRYDSIGGISSSLVVRSSSSRIIGYLAMNKEGEKVRVHIARLSAFPREGDLIIDEDIDEVALERRSYLTHDENGRPSRNYIAGLKKMFSHKKLPN